MLLNHIAIICSSEAGIEFYKKLGFKEESREDRKYDYLVYMSNGMVTLEIYVDKNHPARMTNPEALGLRHLGFEVEKIKEFSEKWKAELKEDKKGRFCFIYDPDGLPIEIRERVLKAPKI